ncbi:hypothetical protein TPCV4_08740 [Cutibacterium avidum]|nr:hypothetical protein TPCV4_08740 [Cutibacterium avidum]
MWAGAGESADVASPAGARADMAGTEAVSVFPTDLFARCAVVLMTPTVLVFNECSQGRTGILTVGVGQLR